MEIESDFFNRIGRLQSFVTSAKSRASQRVVAGGQLTGLVEYSGCVEVGDLVRDLLCVPPRDPSLHTFLTHDPDMQPITVFGTKHL